MKMFEEIVQLSQRVYQLSEELKKKSIQLGLLERKKQQAIADAVDKKEQEVKVQKSLNKALN